MSPIFTEIGVQLLLVAAAISVLAGFVKGAIGFALPMIMISGTSIFLPPDLAIAAVIIPTVVSNVVQALRGGGRAALEALWKFRLYAGIVFVCIALSAQLVNVFPGWMLYLLIGVPITFFALIQLLGARLRVAGARRKMAEVAMALIAGFIGGLSSLWGPPTVTYLTAVETPKAEQVRVQGVIYGVSAVVLFFSHIKSGLMNWDTGQLSTAMLVPVMLGMWLGFQVHDRLDQTLFRKITLAVLIVAGLNLVRRGVMGYLT